MTDQRGCPLCSFLNAADLILQCVIILEAALQKSRVTGDDRQDVSEFMSNAAGQPSDGFHFLRRPQLLFQPAAFGYVARGPLDGNSLAVLIDQSCSDLQPDRLA